MAFYRVKIVPDVSGQVPDRGKTLSHQGNVMIDHGEIVLRRVKMRFDHAFRTHPGPSLCEERGERGVKMFQVPLFFKRGGFRG